MGPPIESTKIPSDVPVAPIVFDNDEPEISARRIIEVLRPDLRDRLRDEPLKIKAVNGGITNKLLLAYFENDSQDKILLRVYGLETDKIIDRAAEIRTLVTLHDSHCAGKVYGIFTNGMCYEFIPGATLTVEKIHDVHISRLIVREMVKLHCIYKKKGDHQEADIFKRTREMHQLIPTSFDDPEQNRKFKEYYPDPTIFAQEMDLLETHLTKVPSPRVFCHNDLLCANIIYDKRSGWLQDARGAVDDRVHFIDFEYAGLNYQAYDLANYFNEFAGLGNCDYQQFPSGEWQLKFLRHYLECWKDWHCEPRGDGVSPPLVSEEELEELYIAVNKFTLASHLFWILWSLVQAKYSAIDFDFLTYGKVRFAEYTRRKEKWLAL